MKKVIVFILLINFFQSFASLTPTLEVSIPMRDNKNLSADIYIPSGVSSGPVILIQTPYNKTNFRNSLPLGYKQNLNSSPYIFVIVDWRGFYASIGATVAQPERGKDGYDVIEWIKNQTWSNGKIGTWGPSALGQIQYLTMKEQHPNHICAVPLVAQPQTSYETYYYGGVLEKSRLEQLDALGYGLSGTVLANPYDNYAWQYSANSTWYPQLIKIPTLQIGGWYDHTVTPMINWYEATRNSAAQSVQNKQWLLIGPWVHGGTGIANVGSIIQGELTYPDAAYKSDSMALDFFDFYLRGISNNWESTSKITYYQLGENRWDYSNAITIPLLSSIDLYLNKNKVLSTNNSIDSTTFISDPKNPTPTIGGPTLSSKLDQGPYDQILLDSRKDVVSFETSELLSDFSIVGETKINLSIQCNQLDADIAIRLVDVYPDGRNMLITDGIQRLRFKNGYLKTQESFLNPNQIYPIEISLPFTNYTWKSGHKIKVFISGNNAVRWDVNLQNGQSMYTAGDTNSATISIHHSLKNPSKISFFGQNLVLKVDDSKSISKFKVYPNPSNTYLEVEDEYEVIKYQIIDLKGEILKSQNFENNLNHIDVSTLEKGLYFLKIETLNEQITTSFIKN